MKKILILAYDFPPYDSIAAQRPASWLKYFREYGLEPTVVTLHWDKKIENTKDYIIPSFTKTTSKVETEHGKTIRVPFKANVRDKLLFRYGFEKFRTLRKFFSFYYSIARFFRFSADNTSEIFFAADRELKSEKYDLIIASGEPFILFRYAHKLSRRHGIFWIADYRDCWSNNRNLPYWGRLRAFLAVNLFRKLEKKYVSNAALITTPAPSYKRLLQDLHPEKPIEVIYNGNDFDSRRSFSRSSQRKDIFEIAYAGRFYKHQQLETFLEGYKAFIRNNNIENTRVVFYGLDFFPSDKRRVLDFSEELINFIHFTPRIPYDQLLKNLQRANLLLLMSKKGMDIIPAKLFDYLPLQRKILLVCNDHGILEKIMKECNAGILVDTAEEVEDHLKVLFHEFARHGEIAQETNGFEKYTRKHQAQKLVTLIRDRFD